MTLVLRGMMSGLHLCTVIGKLQIFVLLLRIFLGSVGITLIVISCFSLWFEIYFDVSAIGTSAFNLEYSDTLYLAILLSCNIGVLVVILKLTIDSIRKRKKSIKW